MTDLPFTSQIWGGGWVGSTRKRRDFLFAYILHVNSCVHVPIF